MQTALLKYQFLFQVAFAKSVIYLKNLIWGFPDFVSVGVKLKKYVLVGRLLLET